MASNEFRPIRGSSQRIPFADVDMPADDELGEDFRDVTPDELRALADRIESRTCTGVTATWCPVHGDCTCPTVAPFSTERTLDDDFCPLHSDQSSHASQEGDAVRSIEKDAKV